MPGFWDFPGIRPQRVLKASGAQAGDERRDLALPGGRDSEKEPIREEDGGYSPPTGRRSRRGGPRAPAPRLQHSLPSTAAAGSDSRGPVGRVHSKKMGHIAGHSARERDSAGRCRESVTGARGGPARGTGWSWCEVRGQRRACSPYKPSGSQGLRLHPVESPFPVTPFSEKSPREAAGTGWVVLPLPPEAGLAAGTSKVCKHTQRACLPRHVQARA